MERSNFKHCDDYIEDPEAPQVLRTYLKRARSPAHGMLSKEPYPKLFADYKGVRIQVVMASTYGDVGVTSDLTAEVGYQHRVRISDLSNFSDKP